MTERIIIFGTGGVGDSAKKLLESQGLEVVGFADNNPQNWGTIKDGVPVYAPPELGTLAFDRVGIGVFKAANQIRSQLLELGIADHKIFVPLEPKRVFFNTVYLPDSGIASPNEETALPTTRTFLLQRRELYDCDFLSRLEDLKKTLHNYNVPIAEVCVVSGGVFQAYGLRSSKLFDDIDIIMTSRFRQLYGSDLVIVSNSAEMHPQNEYDISDDEIITNPAHHFVYCDLKFMSLAILYRYAKDKAFTGAALLEQVSEIIHRGIK